VTRRDGEAAAGGLLATLAIAPFDRRISHALSGRPHRARSLHHTANDIAFFGGSGPFVLSGLVYVAGTEGQVQSIATGALHNMEAIALASAITGVAKGFTGRALPGVQSSHAFSFGRGFHDHNGPFVSFPSGHTAAAFAMAATLGPELGRANARLGDIVGPLAFTGAAAVGVARVIQHVHWPSDLPMAVVIGTWSGRAVEAHAYRRGRVASALRGMTVAPQSNGRTLIGWSSQQGDIASR
jgi:membrane-associated phospholipid phosphatase